MRRTIPLGLVIVLAAVATAAAVPPAAMTASSVPQVGDANFRATLEGIQRTTVTGTVQCDSDTGRINARASASDVGHFSSAQPSEITIDRAGGGIISVTGVHTADPKLTLSGSDTRSTTFGPDIPAPACPGGSPAHCGTTQFQTITVFVQGGIRNGLTLFTRASSPGPPRACPLPSTPAFPQLVQPGLFGAHVTYTAPLPASLLDPGRRVIIIHGTGSATSHRKDIFDAHATTRLSFTLKLVRIR